MEIANYLVSPLLGLPKSDRKNLKTPFPLGLG